MSDEAITWMEAIERGKCFVWLHFTNGHRPSGIHNDDPRYATPTDEERIRELIKKAGMRTADVTDREYQLVEDLYDSDLRYCSR